MDMMNGIWRRQSNVSAIQPPHPALSAYVSAYMGFDEQVGPPVRRRIVATAAPIILIDFKPAGRRAIERAIEEDAARRGPTMDNPVYGLIGSPGEMEVSGHHFGVGILLTPPGAFALLGIPMYELANGWCRLSELSQSVHLRWIAPRLASAGDWLTRFTLLDELLLDRITRCREPSRIAVTAWRGLEASAGRIPVCRLADKVGVSRRRLEALFQEQVGCAPKTAARILRFRKALALITDGARDGRTLAAVAEHCGYSDQAHLSREVRAFAGIPPSRLR